MYQKYWIHLLCFLLFSQFVSADIYKIEAVITRQILPQSQESILEQKQRFKELGLSFENLTAQINKMSLDHSGTTINYPATLYVEYDPESKLISKYRVDFQSPVLDTLNPNFTPEKPVVKFDEDATVIFDYSNGKKYKKYKIQDTEKEGLIDSSTITEPEMICQITMTLNELKFTTPSKSIQAGNEKVEIYEYPQRKTTLKRNERNKVFEVESSIYDPANGKKIDELVQLEWFDDIHFPKMFVYSSPKVITIIECNAAVTINEKESNSSIFSFNTQKALN